MMARPPKPIALMTSNLSKQEVEDRKEAEKKVKGKNNKVYKPRKELPDQVKSIYKSISNELKESDILSNLDIDLLETTAYAIWRMRQAREQINEDGIVITTPQGIVKHPAINIEKDYQNIFQNGCIQLGLSPSARAKLAIIHIENNKEESIEDKVFS